MFGCLSKYLIRFSANNRRIFHCIFRYKYSTGSKFIMQLDNSNADTEARIQSRGNFVSGGKIKFRHIHEEGDDNNEETIQILKEKLDAKCKELGLQRIGFTTAVPPERFNKYLSWIKEDKFGKMNYLSNPDRISKRQDLSLLLPGVKSVIMFMSIYWPGKRQLLSYLNGKQELNSGESVKDSVTSSNDLWVGNNDSGEEKELSWRQGNISCYAWGQDYHTLIGQKLKSICEWLHETYGGEGKWYIDTGPVMERDLAERSGIGFIGKNTLLINEKLGSGGFLGCILTTLPIPADPPRKKTGQCGKCRKCIDNCPTDAIDVKNGYSMDSRKCISYLTIENKDEIPLSLRKQVANAGYIYGCDICQLVCPWNRFDWAPSPTLAPASANTSVIATESASASVSISRSTSSRPPSSSSGKSIRSQLPLNKEIIKHHSPLFGPLDEVPHHLRSPPLLSLLLSLFYNNIDLYQNGIDVSKTNDTNFMNINEKQTQNNHHENKTLRKIYLQQSGPYFNLNEEKNLRSLLKLLLPKIDKRHEMTTSSPSKVVKKQNPNIEQRLVFNTLYKGTAIKRIGVFRMMRNIILVLGGSSNNTRSTPKLGQMSIIDQTKSSSFSLKTEKEKKIIIQHLTLILKFCLTKKKDTKHPSSLGRRLYGIESNPESIPDLSSNVILQFLPQIRILSHTHEHELNILIDQLEWTISQIA